MNVFVILIILCLIGTIIYIIYKHYTVLTYSANKEYTIDVNASKECSYIVWFNIETWNNGKKILFQKKSNNIPTFIVFIGDLTNVLYIYTIANDKYDMPGITFYPYMISYNDCNVERTFYKGVPTSKTFADCKKYCRDNSCVGFVFAQGTGVTGGCYTSTNPEDIFKSTYATETESTNFCSHVSSELKLIEIKKHIPLQTDVKLAITINDRNMIVYIDDEIITTYFLKSTPISSGTITVTPNSYGFTGYTHFKYLDKCLNYQEIKKVLY